MFGEIYNPPPKKKNKKKQNKKQPQCSEPMSQDVNTS